MAANDFPSGGGATSGRSGLMDTIREQASSRLSSQKARAAEGFGGVVDAVRQTGQQLRDKNPALAGYAESAAAQLERWASDFRSKDVSVMVDDVKRFAQQRPVMFLGAAVALGVIAARLMKSAAGEAQATWNSRPMPEMGRRDHFGVGRGLSGSTAGMDIAADRSASRPSSTVSTGSRPRG